MTARGLPAHDTLLPKALICAWMVVAERVSFHGGS